MERMNARTPGRSALAQSCARVVCTLTTEQSQGNANGFDDITQDGFCGLRFFLQRCMARTGDNAMRENRDSEMFEIVGEAILAAVEKSAGLRGALQHQSAARADAESELVGLARAVDNFERVVMKARVDLHVGDGALHREHVAQIRNRLER